MQCSKGAKVGKSIPFRDREESNDAVLLTGGSTVPRNLDIPGRDLKGVHYAMDFLKQQNRINNGLQIPDEEKITAKDKTVVILGGGDTGSDCLGTSLRQGAKEVYQLELLPKPPDDRKDTDLWPNWPMILRTSTSQEEGGTRDYNILTKMLVSLQIA